MIFFTSDHHFGHENIIRFQNRPFSDAAQMDAEMILRWNEVVGHEDEVYPLGDLTLLGKREAANYFQRLNGTIRVLSNPWHHDKRWLSGKYVSASGIAVDLVSPLVVLEMNLGERPQVIVLCHYPLAEWDQQRYGAWHLHGHNHGAERYGGEGRKILNVCVEHTDYQPLSLDEVAARMTRR